MKIDALRFEAALGRPPTFDDLDRCNCPMAGEIGHWQCGWCPTHDKPRFECGCLNRGKDRPDDAAAKFE